MPHAELAGRPAVDVIIPAYESARTIRGTLRALEQQTFRDFAVTVVDSSPNEETASLVEAEFPWVRLIRWPARLLPHAARTIALERTTADVVVSTDPDAYAAPDWLAVLVAAHQQWKGPVAGAVACYGQRWLDHGIHWRKFGLWLPRGPERWITSAPSVNLLVPRSLLGLAGGFRGDVWNGDVLLTQTLAAAGWPTRFVPEAVVFHHHLMTFRGLLRERFIRGRELANLRAGEGRWGRKKIALWVLLTVLPVRYARALARDVLNAHRVGELGGFFATFPVSQGGTLAALAGELVGFGAALRR
jgi:glycosyltransferase involved in cell wall biosynthesis